MKLLHLKIALVVLMFCSLTGATQVVNDNEDLRETIKSLQKTVESLQISPNVCRLSKYDEVMKQEEVAELRKSKNDNEDLGETIKYLQAEVENNYQMTAGSLFLATISNYTVSILPGEPIPWESAPINPGGNFDTVLGTYTSPVDGYYQFPVVKHGNYYSGAFYILVDDVRYAFVNEFANTNSTPLGSATINIELTA